MMMTPMSAACRLVPPPSLVSFQPGVGMNLEHLFRPKEKVVVVVGATGTGKSRLAIDLARRYPAEIVNSDKMQVYKGLDIATNKVTEEECREVPHHLLGIADSDSNFTADDFCHHASQALDSIVARDRLPIIAGGSNSFICALLTDHATFRLKYECLFLWVDVSLDVLDYFVAERVDRMVDAGLVDEVARMFDPHSSDYSRGIRRAIGVPELDAYFRAPSGDGHGRTRARLLRSAIAKIKDNTRLLARRQLQKIHWMNSRWGWNMKRLDATPAFLRRNAPTEAWDCLVARPAIAFVDGFLFDCDFQEKNASVLASSSSSQVPMTAAVAAASR